ncbi:MAG: FixH family protein [Pseudomonadota bacterium]
MTTQPRKLKGGHVLAMFVGGFGIIIGVNFFMAFKAVSTFPGLEVSSSYADSQTFDLRRDAQEALGWDARVEVDGTVLTLHLTGPDGAPAQPAELTALLTRPTNRLEDQELDFVRGPDGGLHAPVVVSPGRWRLRLTGLSDDGTEYRHNITFSLPESR